MAQEWQDQNPGRRHSISSYKCSLNLRTSRSREKGKWSPIKEALKGLHTFFLVAPEKMHRELWGDVCSDVRVQRMNVYLMWVVVCFQVLFILSNNYYRYIPRLSLNKASTWSCAPDHIQMYSDWDTIAQLLPMHQIQQHVFATWLFKGKSKHITIWFL